MGRTAATPDPCPEAMARIRRFAVRALRTGAAWLGTAPKIAAFGMLMRALVDRLGALATDWSQMLAVLSMAAGNVIALAQTNIKRMLAYSTVAHIGLLFVGMAVRLSSPFPSLSRLATCTGAALNPSSRNARCSNPQIRPLLLPNTTDMHRPGFSTRSASAKALHSSFSYRSAGPFLRLPVV